MLKFMIVDDSLILRRYIRKIVEDMGHSVVCEAKNGLQAIENFNIFKPDLITLDITMPGVGGIKNGIEALREIRKIDKNVKIIMVTAQGEEGLVMDAIANGANGYLLKPITSEKMQVWLDKLDINQKNEELVE